VSSLDGTYWLDELIATGVATNLGGNGYPDRYMVAAGSLAQLLIHGVPKRYGSIILARGADPSTWIANAKIELEQIKAIDPYEQLIVEVWDQS
jgi:hypothetical protein